MRDAAKHDPAAEPVAVFAAGHIAKEATGGLTIRNADGAHVATLHVPYTAQTDANSGRLHILRPITRHARS